MATAELTRLQRAHVAQVFPECREDMTRFLATHAIVGVRKQREVGESPPYAIFVIEQPDFWIDCCETSDAAELRARALELRVA